MSVKVVIIFIMSAASNRTSLELKLTPRVPQYCRSHVTFPSNRTSLELKHVILKINPNVSVLLIAPVWN